MDKRKLGILVELLLAIVGIYGILIASGLFSGSFTPVMFSYYTIITNIICVVYLIGKVIYKIKYPRKKKEFLGNFRGAVIICILVTGLVFHFLLGKLFNMNASNDIFIRVGNIIVHYIIPYSVLLDYLIFDKKGCFKKWSPFTWIVIPLLYFAYTLITGCFKLINYGGTYYPYWFIDVSQIGYAKVFMNAGLITVIFLGICYLLYFFDNMMSKRKSR